ncbi:FAD-dependent oxidoreductase [Phosphitispora sp. TUW77]|uniref:oxidoreductase n=1 Tax=Phosphitispora sp. TUW77 TaxID=3152361 RepID=UPI003AB5B982
MSSEFPYLLSPATIGPVEIRNRAVISAHHSNLVECRTEDMFSHGKLGKRYAAYVEERAKGGIGLFILGQYIAHPTGLYEVPFTDCPGYDDLCLPGMKMAVEACHKHGAKAFVQFAHAGFMNGGGRDGTPVWSASELSPPPGGIVSSAMAKEMDKDDIADLIEHYRMCARNAKAAGANGVEIHAAHAYLLNQFLTPLYNKRTDEYGGSLENRMRLPMEVLAAVREVIGKDMALGIRLSCEEYAQGGLTIQDHQEIAKAFEAQGVIDYINVSQGLIPNFVPIVVPLLTFPHAAFASNAGAIKEAVTNLKVLATGRIIDPVEAEQILADGHADGCVMTRAHLAEPEIIKKTMEGRVDEIRGCVGCGNGCTNGMGGGIGCTHNPVAGHELDWGGELDTAAKKKKVMVIGGGLAGLECAWVAQSRGHDVTVYEKSGELGGQAILAPQLPGSAELDGILRWRKMMVDKCGVKVVLNTEVTAEMVEKEAPDAVVLATGSIPRRDGFSPYGYRAVMGWESPNVFIPEEIIKGEVEVGQNVAVYDPQAFHRGAGIAEKLAEEGKDVTLIMPTVFPAQTNSAMIWLAILPRLNALGIKMVNQTLILAINGSELTTYHTLHQKPGKMEGFDTIVISGVNTANRGLLEQIRGKVSEIHVIGDCKTPRRMDHATLEGYRAGRAL